MTNRERMMRTLRFQTVDRVPDFEFAAWQQTIDRWHGEGLPLEYNGVWKVLPDYFKTDNDKGYMIELKNGTFPKRERIILEDKGEHLIVQDGDGGILEILKPEFGASIPRQLKYAIETKADWIKMRDELLNPDSPGRVPANFEEQCKMSWSVDETVRVRCGSLYGWLRNWMGVEELSIAIYEEPEWVEEMMEHLTNLTLSLLSKIAGKAKVDMGVWWEDMCFNKGPLLSPRHFTQWMLPRYKRITSFLRQECGCEFHVLDCDGNIHELAPLWLEGGINVMFPLEAAHTDAYKLSDQFGNKMALRGNFNKIALIEGKAAIDKEFERITPLLKRGGFIPHTDHLVPPDVSFENYCYYRERKCELIGKKPE